jgi:hypothetical protein
MSSLRSDSSSGWMVSLSMQRSTWEPDPRQVKQTARLRRSPRIRQRPTRAKPAVRAGQRRPHLLQSVDVVLVPPHGGFELCEPGGRLLPLLHVDLYEEQRSGSHEAQRPCCQAQAAWRCRRRCSCWRGHSRRQARNGPPKHLQLLHLRLHALHLIPWSHSILNTRVRHDACKMRAFTRLPCLWPSCTFSVSWSTTLLIQSRASSLALCLGSLSAPPAMPPLAFASFSHALNRSISRSIDLRASMSGCLSFMSAPAILQTADAL